MADHAKARLWSLSHRNAHRNLAKAYLDLERQLAALREEVVRLRATRERPVLVDSWME